MFLTGFVGFTLTLPVALLGAWRAGLLAWWPPLLLLAGPICAQAIPDGFGLLIWAATLAVLSYVLWRIRNRTRGDGSRGAEPRHGGGCFVMAA